MNEYAHIIYQKTARILTVGCGLLFAIFSFVYLYVFQRDSLEALHYSLAQGRTHFAPMASALVITLILILLRWGINSLLGLKGKVRTLSYLPSFFILWALTDISMMYTCLIGISMALAASVADPAFCTPGFLAPQDFPRRIKR